MGRLLSLCLILLSLFTAFAKAKPTDADIPDARMLRFPDVSKEKIVFYTLYS